MSIEEKENTQSNDCMCNICKCKNTTIKIGIFLDKPYLGEFYINVNICERCLQVKLEELKIKKQNEIVNDLLNNLLNIIKFNPLSIQNVKNPSEELQLEAVKQCGYAIQYIENPTEKVKLEAVKKDASVIGLIENPSKELQLEAIKQDIYAIRYIKNPDEAIKKLYFKMLLEKYPDLNDTYIKI